MKNVASITILILLLFSCSGSDELTHSKAEKIIKECIKKEPMYGSSKTGLGKNIALTQKQITAAKKLAEKGIIKYSKTSYFQTVQLTDKAESLLLDKEETMRVYATGKYTKAAFKTCEYKVSEIIEIKETPAFNEATVIVKFKKINKTEISELDKNKTDFLTIKITIRKTSNGWKLCE